MASSGSELSNGNASEAGGRGPRFGSTAPRGAGGSCYDVARAMASRPAEPCARRTLIVAHREAARKLWGPSGLDLLARGLPDDVRRATIDAVVITEEWLPERYVTSWHEAAWEGPCGRETQALFRFLHAVMDEGFGRVQRFMLSLITPAILFSRGEALWRHDHTHGELHCELNSERSGTIRLRNHPYTTSPFFRRSLAEIYRYAGSLARCRSIRASHTLDPDGTLVVKIDWD
jgi:hypothetical protein